MATLCLFNPDHDEAIASNKSHLTVSLAAQQLARDLAMLPVWYAADDALVVADGALPNVYHALRGEAHCVATPPWGEITAVQPWGWNRTLHTCLAEHGCNEAILPSKVQLEQWRTLAHRRMAVEANRFLIDKLSTLSLPPVAEELHSIEALERFIRACPDAVLKAPWSGSGRGVMMLHGDWNDNLHNRCRHIIERQGCVMGEPYLDKVQDFAMEFLRENDAVIFVGYSLFDTRGGRYCGNRLLSNTAIVHYLSQWLSEDTLLAVRQVLTDFIEKKYVGYIGPVGIDMLIYRHGACFSLYPTVEINLRMTMGMVACCLYNRYLDAHSTGILSIDYEPRVGVLLADHRQRTQMHPPILHGGCLTEGYITLCPIVADTHYRARLEVRSGAAV